MDRRRLRAVCSVVVGSLLLMPGARAHVGSTETSVMETFTNAQIAITPGLCVSGDAPGCVGPAVAEFRVVSDVCTVGGRFEGTDLPDGSTCSFELYGFMTGLVDGTKPACSGLRFRTSDATTAWGDGRTSVLVIDGTARNISIEGITIGTTAVFTEVWWDDDDADLDPVGDHSSIAHPALVLRQGGDGIPCVTSAVTQAVMPGGVVLDY